MGSKSGENSWQGSGWRTRQGGSWQSRRGGSLWTGQSHISVHINWEEQLGSETDHATQGSSSGKQSLKPLIESTCGG